MQAKIHPLQTAASLSKESCATLLKCIKEVREALGVSLQFYKCYFAKPYVHKKHRENKICRLFKVRLKLMLTAAAFLLNGYFIFDGAKSLEKLMVRYLWHDWSLWRSNLFYRWLKKLLKLGQIVLNFQVIGFFIPVKRSLARLLLMVCSCSLQTHLSHRIPWSHINYSFILS